MFGRAGTDAEPLVRAAHLQSWRFLGQAGMPSLYAIFLFSSAGECVLVSSVCPVAVGISRERGQTELLLRACSIVHNNTYVPLSTCCRVGAFLPQLRWELSIQLHVLIFLTQTSSSGRNAVAVETELADPALILLNRTGVVSQHEPSGCGAG